VRGHQEGVAARQAPGCMNSWILIVLSALLLSGGGMPLLAQTVDTSQHPRSGFWIGFGAGAAWSSIDCTACGPLLPDDPWEGGTGFGWYLAMGGTVQPNLLVGGELNMYGKRNSEQQRDATLGGVSAVLQYYPLAASGFYLKGGAGLGVSLLAGGPGLIESGGWLAQGGAGYDVRPGRRFSISPFATVVQVFSEGAEGRNQGVAAVGPRNPRYLQVGIGLHWY
jgi:hypothetical protein